MSENRPTQTDSSDPLASLHRMSTTAGAASQDYVAINFSAVVAFILGVASLVVFFGNVLLVMPVAAIVFGIVAIRQIRGSSGTQTGMGLALIGVLVAVGAASTVTVQQVNEARARHAEQQAINAVVGELDRDILSGDYASALKLFTDEFNRRPDMSMDRFTGVWKAASANPNFGKIVSIGTNDRIGLDDVAPDGTRGAGTLILIKFEKVSDALRRIATFKKVGGQWKIDGMPELFPAPVTEPPGGRPPT